MLRVRSYEFRKEFDKNLDPESNDSDLTVLVRNLIGIQTYDVMAQTS